MYGGRGHYFCDPLYHTLPFNFPFFSGKSRITKENPPLNTLCVISPNKVLRVEWDSKDGSKHYLALCFRPASRLEASCFWSATGDAQLLCVLLPFPSREIRLQQQIICKTLRVSNDLILLPRGRKLDEGAYFHMDKMFSRPFFHIPLCSKILMKV